MLITIFITYLKRKQDDSLVYAGRTHEKVSNLSPDELVKILRKRDSSHQKTMKSTEELKLKIFLKMRTLYGDGSSN